MLTHAAPATMPMAKFLMKGSSFFWLFVNALESPAFRQAFAELVAIAANPLGARHE
jgi:hypothetical protein